MTKQRKGTLFPYASCNASPPINLRVLLNIPINAALAHVGIAVSARIVVVNSGNCHSFTRTSRIRRKGTDCQFTNVHWVVVMDDFRSSGVRRSGSFGRELLNCPQEVGVYPRQGKLLRQAATNSRVKTVTEAGYFVNVVPALAACLVERAFELSNIGR